MSEDSLLGLEFWRKRQMMGKRGVVTGSRGGKGGSSWSSYWETQLYSLLNNDNTILFCDYNKTDKIISSETAVSEWMCALRGSVGSELVNQSAWYTSTYWTSFAANWSQSGSTLVSNGNNGSIYLQNFWTIGKTYRIEITVNRTSGTLRIPYDGGSGYSTVTSTGSYIFHYKPAISSTMYITSSSFNGTIGDLKIQEVTGVALFQSKVEKRPSLSDGGLLFDGVNDVLSTITITLAQPTTIYLVMKQMTYTVNARIFGGITGANGELYQRGAKGYLAIGSPTEVTDRDYMGFDMWSIVKVVFNGENSYVQINNGDKHLGNAGTDAMNGIVLGGRAASELYNSNIEVKSLAVLNEEDSESDSLAIYTALKNYYWGSNAAFTPEIMIGFVLDDTALEQYSVAYPLLETYGFKGTIAITSSYVNENNPYSEGILTDDQLLEMQASGHEIAAHGHTHTHIGEITLEQAITEFITAKSTLEGFGLNIYNFVYPGGSYNETNAKALLDYYDSGITNGAIVQVLPAPLSHVYRGFIEGQTLGQLTAWVDEVIAADGYSILILAGHPSTWDEAKIAIVEDLFDYIAAQGQTIKPLKYIIDKIKTYTPIEYYEY